MNVLLTLRSATGATVLVRSIKIRTSMSMAGMIGHEAWTMYCAAQSDGRYLVGTTLTVEELTPARKAAKKQISMTGRLRR